MYSDGELICPNCYCVCQDEVWRCKDNHVADDSAYCSEHCLHDSLFIISEDIDRALEEFRKREEEADDTEV